MRIESLCRRSVGDRTRIQALITYEDTDLPPLEVYYEAGPPLADALEATPEAFVAAAFPLALWEGERRLKVEGALDTTLASGLRQAASLLSAWHERCGSVTLEPTEGFRAVRSQAEPRAVALFTGGVDAMAMLRENRQLVPLDHPNSIRTVLYAFGFSYLDLPDGVEDPLLRARHEAQAARIQALGERVGFELIRLDSNIVRLHPSTEAFYEVSHSGAFVPPFLGSPSYVTDALIASDGEGGMVQTPHGSHPLLDIHYSTGAVRVQHVQPGITRYDKVGLIADWEPAYDSLQVCHGEFAPPPDMPNCGKCEKCVRTMVELVAWQALPRFTTFPVDDVTPEMIDGIKIRGAYTYITMPELLAGLERVGRDDLLLALEAQIKRASAGPWARRTRKWRRSLSKRFGRSGSPAA